MTSYRQWHRNTHPACMVTFPQIPPQEGLAHPWLSCMLVPLPLYIQTSSQSLKHKYHLSLDLQYCNYMAVMEIVGRLVLVANSSSCLVVSTTILLFFLALVITRKRGNKAGKSNQLPPGPRPLPLIGNLHLLGHNPHLSLQRLAATYGPIFHLTLGELPTVVVSSARTARLVLKTHDLALASRPQLYAAKKLLYGCTDVAFAPYGPYWRHVRKISILELLSAKRVESYAFAREAEVSRLITRVLAAAAEHRLLDLSWAIGLYANGVVCRSAFGKEFSGGAGKDFKGMLEELEELLGGFSVGDFFPRWEWIHAVTGMKRRLERTFHRFDRFFDEVIGERLERRREREGGEPDRKDLLDVLLDLKDQRDGVEMPLTMDNIKAVILDMFAGATGTTFAFLDWGMTELLVNPKAMKRAQDEVQSVVGDRRTVLESDLPRMHYLKAVTKEIFRIHPPAPVLLPRESMEEVTIDGYDIPAKTRFFVNAYAIGRDPETWENPNSFQPERFMESSIDYKGQDYELIPFGAGRRGCPAIAFGVAGIEIALAQLLHSFDWELPPGIRAEDLDLTEVFGVPMHKKAKLLVVAKPRFV